MSEMERFLKSYEADETIRAIWMKNSGSDECFSKGIDYLYLAMGD